MIPRAKQGLTRLRTAGVDLHSTSSCTREKWDVCDEAPKHHGCCCEVVKV